MTPLPFRFLVASSAPTIVLFVPLQSTCWRVVKIREGGGGDVAIFTDSLSTLQALNSADLVQMIQGLHSSLAKVTAQFSVSLQWVPAYVGLTGNEIADRLAKNRQTGSEDTESCHLQRGQDTSPLSVQWRLEERQRWISGTP